MYKRKTKSEEDFKALLQQAKDGDTSEDTLLEILQSHHDHPMLIAELDEDAPKLLDTLRLHAELNCIHLRLPLLHKQEKFYRPLPEKVPEPERYIGDYPVVRSLHAGSMESETYVGMHPEGYLCLIKQYWPKAVDLSPRTMFAHQERIIQRLNQHPDPRFEEILDHFLWEDDSYIQIKPYLICSDLWDWMDDTEDRMARLLLLQELAEVLDLLHSLDIAHTDLKPGQVLILSNHSQTGGPQFVLIDYDFSMVDGVLTMAVGSVPYYAPEQFSGDDLEGHQAGVYADTYAFCVLVHRLLTSYFPFGDGRTEQTSLDDLKNFRDLRSMTIPYKPLEEILKRGLDPIPEERPSLKAIGRALRSPELLHKIHTFPLQRPQDMREEYGLLGAFLWLVGMVFIFLLVVKFAGCQ